jgi:hypothetical protein
MCILTLNNKEGDMCLLQIVEKGYLSRQFFILSASNLPIFLKKFVPAHSPVDFRSRCFAFRGRAGKPPQR